MIDRVAASSGGGWSRCRSGSSGSWTGLLDGSLGFGGEESAGASFLRRDGTVWTTDKDGIIMDLLAAEITARTGKDPARALREPGRRASALLSTSASTRRRRSAEERSCAKLSPDEVTATELAGDPITAKLTGAPGNGAPIGGLKVDHRERLVRGAAVRDRKRLQALRRELPRRGPPPPDPGGSTDHRGRGVDGSHAMTTRSRKGVPADAESILDRGGEPRGGADAPAAGHRDPARRDGVDADRAAHRTTDVPLTETAARRRGGWRRWPRKRASRGC